MRFAPIDLSAFPAERERTLKSIYRYRMFETILYRSNLWMHSLRMLWLVEEMSSLAQKHLSVDIEKARAMALVHDDAEIITGDIQAGVKALMSKKELARLARDEEVAVKKLSKRFPKKINGYEYKQLLMEMISKETIESQLVTYVDKLDAYCESMHEILAGNVSILRSVMLYVRTFATFEQKYPALRPFISDKSNPLTFVDNRWNLNFVPYSRYTNLKPYTRSTIKKRSDFPFYDDWKRITLSRGGEEGLGWLIKRTRYIMKK